MIIVTITIIMLSTSNSRVHVSLLTEFETKNYTYLI